MGALHIVGEDFQFRLKIDLGAVAQQQPFRRLAAVRSVRALGDRNLALIDAASLPASHIFEKLRAQRLAAGMDDMRCHIGMTVIHRADA